jgi:hypothetical protein
MVVRDLETFRITSNLVITWCLLNAVRARGNAL